MRSNKLGREQLDAPIRLKQENDRIRHEVALLIEEMRRHNHL